MMRKCHITNNIFSIFCLFTQPLYHPFVIMSNGFPISCDKKYIWQIFNKNCFEGRKFVVNLSHISACSKHLCSKNLLVFVLDIVIILKCYICEFVTIYKLYIHLILVVTRMWYLYAKFFIILCRMMLVFISRMHRKQCYFIINQTTFHS